MATDLETREYLTRVFAMNPAEEAHGILDIRQRYHRASTKEPREATRGQANPDRDELREQLEALRAELWDHSAEELAEAVSRLPLDLFPDLKRVAERLLVLSRHRPVFDELAARSPGDEEFIDFLRTLLAAPTQVALELRDRFEERARGRVLRSSKSHGVMVLRQASLRTAKRNLRHLRKHHPELFALEPEWFEVVLSFEKHEKLGKKIRDNWWWFFVAWLVFKLIQYLTRWSD